jgi:hypothetical protein
MSIKQKSFRQDAAAGLGKPRPYNESRTPRVPEVKDSVAEEAEPPEFAFG